MGKDALSGDEVGIAVVGILLLIALVIVVVTIGSFRRGKPLPVAAPSAAPFVEPAAAPPAQEMRFEETVEAGFSGVFVALMVVANLVGALILFSGGKTYVETTVFGQLANIFDRTNGLLILLILNQILGLGVIAGRRRTFTLRK